MKFSQFAVFLPLAILAVALIVGRSPLSPDDGSEDVEVPAADSGTTVDAEPSSQFLRFVEDPDATESGRLETAVVEYERDDGARVALIGAVHVADPAYYDELERRFASYDALLYEMIHDPNEDFEPSESDSGLSFFQRFLTDVLALEFQLDGIDYSKSNFVHADMDPATFFRMQAQKGESIFTLMLRSMFEQMKMQAEGKGSQLNGVALLLAFSSDDSARSLKYLFAKEFDKVERLIAGIEGDDPDGSVILKGRNRVAMRVLEKQLAGGKKNLGVFYGAAHMIDLEQRVRKLGFVKKSEEFLVAWDVKVMQAAPKKQNLFHIPWFSDAAEK